MFPILLFGIGNTLRSDDGVGIYVCEQLQQLQLKNVEIQTAQQLQTELIDEMFNYKAVIVIDASIATAEVCFEKVEAGGTAASSSHHMNLSMMQALAQQLYGKTIELYSCAIPAVNFELGNELSPLTKQHAATAVQLLQQQITLLSY
jgi:hydrogenase maturation protease